MDTSIAALLDEASRLPINSNARKRLEDRVLEETEVINMEQLATFVEAVARRAALENGDYGDRDTAESLFQNAQTISEALRSLHEVIQTIA